VAAHAERLLAVAALAAERLLARVNGVDRDVVIAVERERLDHAVVTREAEVAAMAIGAIALVLLRDLRHNSARLVARDAVDPSISADGRRIAFSSTNPAPGKPDDRRGVFVRDLRTGSTKLASAPVPPPAGGPTPPLAPPLKAIAASVTLGARQVEIVDNAFHRGTDRPVIRLTPGQRVTWLWRSRQSHEVTLYRGPGSVRSPTQSHGRYSARLTRPGTYEFVCAIHAPGMRMTAIVTPTGT
jgi:plastocyanin